MLQQPTKDLLTFLRQNPDVRTQIRAAPNKTLLYAGNFFKPIWKELADFKRTHPQAADKQILPDILAIIRTQNPVFPNLLSWAQSIDQLSPWRENGFIAWRALSGIFASNAVGAVSFSIGSNISSSNKVFAATELHVLMRNPNVDAVTKDVLAYYERCLRSGQSDLNFGFMAG